MHAISTWLLHVLYWVVPVADEYILPKIAERDLRRFSNLRSTSSKLGVRIPLDMVLFFPPLRRHLAVCFLHFSKTFCHFIKIFYLQMPVPCPVSAIVKQRKVQGRDYFEVSWQEMEGLQTSIVPADLMERWVWFLISSI